MSDTRRNQWGQYLVLPPNGTKEVGYVRVTTVAKTLDDGGGLIPWKATATVVGKSRRPGLAAQWAALISKHADPWYSSNESKAECKRLVEECATAGGSTDRAEIGTALHALCEQMDRGHPLVGVTPDIQADLDAYKATIDKAGVTFDVDGIEAIVVLDEWRVAGTADRLAARLPDGRNVVCDLKTGADLAYSWQSIAVQLAAYANADARYEQLEVGGRRHPMPDFDRTTGLVIHLPAGEARCTLYTVDLVAGLEAFERSMWCRGWRKRRDLAVELAVAPVDAFTSNVIADAMTGWPLEMRQRLAAIWPAGYPTPGQVRRREAVWTDAQFAHITQLCDDTDTPFWNQATPPTSRFADRNTTPTQTIGA